MKLQKHTMDLTTGPVTARLMAFTLPILASNLLQHLYNAADRAVVGKFAANGDIALAAVGSTGSAIMLLVNLVMGLALGANVVCANMRGAGNQKDLRKAMHTSVLLAIVAGIAAMVVGILAAEPFLLLMGSPKTVIKAATLYTRIYFVGVPFQLLYNFGASILRAHGDTKRPMTILAVSGLANVALNLVFVIGFHMDVDGVAWATAISQVIAAAVVLWILFKPAGGYDLNVSELRFHKQELLAVIRVGVPSGLNGSVFSISNVIIQTSINSLGPVVMAGNTAAASYTGLVYQVLNAFYTACISFGGQCYGAKKYKRIDKLVGQSILLSCSMVTALSVLSTVFPHFILGLFTNSRAAMDAALGPLLITSWGYVIYSVSEMFLGALRGMRRSGMPTLLNAVAICVPRLAWVFLAFPHCRTIGFLYLCYPISYFTSVIAQGSYYFIVRRKLDRQEDEVTH